MAEYVEWREERLLPDYEQMKNLKIVNDDELKKIQRSRENFDYRISKQSKSIKDFSDFITFERKLLALFQERQKNRRQNYYHIIYSTAKHVKALYREALYLFPADLSTWESFIKFCKHSNFAEDVSRTFERMLQFHGDKSDVWLRAAMWEYIERNNPERANNLFLRGNQRHPTCPKLTEQYFKFMLVQTSKLNSELIMEDGTESEQSISLKRVDLIYENSKDKIKDINFLGNLIQACEDFPFTKHLQKKIIEDMISKYPETEEVWDILARRELRGFHMVDLENNSETFSKKTVDKCIEMCCLVYQNGLKILNTPKMWKFFIDTLLELNQDMDVEPVLKRKKLGNVLKEAHEAKSMSEEHYLFYTALLGEGKTQNNELVSEILEKATELYPTSSKLWCQRLHHAIKMKSEEHISKVFSKGKQNVEDLVELSKIMISYWNLTEQNSKIEALFKEICFNIGKTSGKFREYFLEWTSKKKSIEEVRSLYDKLAKLPPPSLELHLKMAEIESHQETKAVERWRNCYEQAAFLFGNSSVNLWMDYIRFEQEKGDPYKVTLLYQRAKDTLDRQYIDDFIGSYSLLRTL